MGVEGNLGNGNNDGVAPKMTLADSESKGQVPPPLLLPLAAAGCSWLLLAAAGSAAGSSCWLQLWLLLAAAGCCWRCAEGQQQTRARAARAPSP